MRTDAGPSGVTGVGRGHFALTWDRFVEHLERIEHVVGMPPAPVHERTRASSERDTWCLTFDDGGASAVAVGEELCRRGWRAYFFITTALIGQVGFVDEDGIRELDGMGHVVGSHSVTHPERMSSLPPGRILEEWTASAATLSDLIRREVSTGSVPGGSYRRNVAVLAARAGITTLFTSEPVRAARWVDDCLVVGRYPVHRGTSASEAARAAMGHPRPWVARYLGWNARKAAKTVGGKYYYRARRRLLNARYSAPARREVDAG